MLDSPFQIHKVCSYRFFDPFFKFRILEDHEVAVENLCCSLAGRCRCSIDIIVESIQRRGDSRFVAGDLGVDLGFRDPSSKKLSSVPENADSLSDPDPARNRAAFNTNFAILGHGGSTAKTETAAAALRREEWLQHARECG